MRKKGWTKALASAAVAFAMAITLAPAGAAMADEASGETQQLGGLQTWEAPTAKTPLGFTGDDGKQYTYITSSARKVSESTADVLGISNVTVVPGQGNPFKYNGTAAEIFDSIKTNARFGIYGSDVNQNMNPYYANYFYDKSVGGAQDLVARDMILVNQSMNPGAPSAAYTTVSDEYGTSPVLAYRPDILYGVGTLKDEDTNQPISFGPANSSVSDYSNLVKDIVDGTIGAEHALPGDADYDPYYVMYDMGAYTTGIAANLYSLANAAEAIIDRTAGSDNPKTTRYEDPMEIAENFEAYLLGTQDAVLAAIDKGTVERKNVAIVHSVSEDNTEIYLWPDVNAEGASKRDYTEFLAATTDNIAKGKEIVNVGSNHLAKATAADIMACDVVFIAAGDGGTGNGSAEANVKDKLNTALAAAGYTDESKYPPMNVYTPKTVLHHNRGGSVENAVLLGSLVGFAYPEVVNPVYSLAYFYQNFYHIKPDRLADAMGMNMTGMSLPTGVAFSLEGYEESDYESMLNDGLKYYFDNKKNINKAYSTLNAINEPGLLSFMVEVTNNELDAVNDALNTVSGDNTALENDKAALENEKAALEKEKAALQQEKAALEKEKNEAVAAKEAAEKAASAALAKAQLTSKTKSAKKGKVTVAWDAVDGASGYEVKVGAKTYTVKNGKLSKTVKAAKGKKVKVRVRAFKDQGDNTLYGAWSGSKKVKVKK